jgi:hypothetical protein
MKKNRILLIVLIILIIPTVYFIFKNSETTIRKELSDFAIKDTAAITKIFLADRNNHSVTLERKDNNKWLLDNKYEPRPELIRLILETFYKISVRNKVAKAAYNNVIKSLATSGTKCEVYIRNETQPFKTYYIGGQTEDALGTFMMIDKSSAPFVTEIPGFNGYLSPRFSPDAEAWRQPIIFNTPLQEIKSISVSYLNFPEKSFTIHSTNGKFSVESPLSKKQILPVDSVAIENYLSFYSNVFYEGRAKDLNTSKVDSIIHGSPTIVFTLISTNGTTRELDIYPMPISSASLALQDSTEKPLKYDLDRMYGYIKPENNFVIIQHYNFDKLLRQLSDFSLKK